MGLGCRRGIVFSHSRDGGLLGWQRGFTLVELLVSISIISLLISILLPSLNEAKEVARRAMCGNNLHNFGLNMHMYANEYGGVYWDGEYQAGAYGGWLGDAADPYAPAPGGLTKILYDDYDAEPDALACPSYRNASGTSRLRNTDYWDYTYIPYLGGDPPDGDPYGWMIEYDDEPKGPASGPDFALATDWTKYRGCNHRYTGNYGDVTPDVPYDQIPDPEGGNVLYNPGYVIWKDFDDMDEYPQFGWEAPFHSWWW